MRDRQQGKAATVMELVTSSDATAAIAAAIAASLVAGVGVIHAQHAD